MKTFALSLTSAAIAIAGFTAPVHAAGTSTGALEVTATVDPYCQVSTTPVNFGNYRPDGNTVFTTGKLTLTCTKNTTPTLVRLDLGKNADTGTARRMLGLGADGQPADTLAYELYKPTADNACPETSVDVWGNDQDTGLSVDSVILGGDSKEISVCGKLAAGQFVSPDVYADTVTASVDF